MDLGGSMDKRDSRGSSTPPSEGGSGGGGGPSGVIRRRGSLFELVTGREPIPPGRTLSGSDNAINTRHRLESRLPKPTSLRSPATGVTIVRPTKEARKAEIVAAVTRRLYTARKKPDPRAEPPPSLSENAEENDQSEPKELKLCSNARARLQEISKRAIALGLHRRLRKDCDTQTEEMRSALRFKEKSVSTDEPTREVSVETTATACEANLGVDFGKRVEMAEKSSQWKAESASIGTQSSPFLPPPVCHIVQPPPVLEPFWLYNWWPNLPWGMMGCCHHEPKRRAHIPVDSADDFSDDSLESVCGLSRGGPDGASGDTLVSEPKPALWETLTLRSGKQFKDNSPLYQPHVFQAHRPLASLFQTELSHLGREHKSTQTESEVDEKASNTEPLTATTDEQCQTTLPCQQSNKPCSFFETNTAPRHFQLVCDFTVQTDPVHSCSCHPPQECFTATPQVFEKATTSATRPQIQTPTIHWPKTPFSTPDIIAQASNDCKNVLDTQEPASRLPQPPSEVEVVPSSSQNRNGVGGLWENDRPFASLDNTLLQSQQPSEDSSRAKSLDSIFQPNSIGQNSSRPNSKKFRLPCLSENKTPIQPATVTARAVDEISSPTKTNQNPTKRITPSSFLSPKGRRLLLTWLNNPGSNPPTSTSLKSGRKTFNGRVTRRHVSLREKNHRRVAIKRTGTTEIEKVAVYHNLSLLINEATNYVRTITQNRPGSSDGEKRQNPEETHIVLDPQGSSPKTQDSSTQSENRRSVSLSTDPAITAEKGVSTTERLTTGTQCVFFTKSNTFALFWISRSTQTDMSLWNNQYLLPDDILLEADFFKEPILDCPKFPDRTVNIDQIDQFRDRYDSVPTVTGYCGRSVCSNDFITSSRLPCQHSSPRAYLKHLVSLRRGIVEACQSPPARPTGVG